MDLQISTNLYDLLCFPAIQVYKEADNCSVSFNSWLAFFPA